MITGWRLTKFKYANPPSSAFDGEGARRRGGRWSAPGRRVAYASSSLALASLEYFVNLEPADAPADLAAIRVEIPDDVKVDRLAVSELPLNWRHRPYPAQLHEVSEDWIANGPVCLLVPSVVIPLETNMLINPLHKAFERLIFHPAVAFEFDARMWK